MTQNALIYLRVSSEEQAKGYSLQTQLQQCQQYAAQHAYTVLSVIEDRQTGEELDRPGLMTLFDFVATKTVHAVITCDPDRLSRGGPAHHAIIQMLLAKHGAKVEYVFSEYVKASLGIVLDDTAKQNLAWYENQQRRARSLQGKLDVAKTGKVMIGARPPYGYQYRDGELVLDDEEAAIVQRVYRWLLAGESTCTIAKKLTVEGVPTRGDKTSFTTKRNGYAIWHPSSVRKILHNETYTGVWYYNKTKSQRANRKLKQTARPMTEQVAIPVPAIIDRATYEAAQKQLVENQAKLQRTTKHEYLLQGLVYCACGLCCACKHRRELRYYRCPVKGGQYWKRTCQTRFGVRVERLDALVWGAVTTLFSDAQNLRQQIKRQRQGQQTNSAFAQEQLEAIAAAKLDTERRIGVLLDQILDDEFPRSIIEERKQLLFNKLKQLESEEAKTNVKLSAMLVTPEQEQTLLALAATAPDSLEKLSFAEKKELLRVLQLRVTVVDKQQVILSILGAQEEATRIP
ncbi:MAG: recombinase family protein [Caldilinea sp. CFX5]|nr:recombinase family protein [Caldilinea sp. CFX5]